MADVETNTDNPYVPKNGRWTPKWLASRPAPPKNAVDLADPRCPGLTCRIGPSGSKSFRWKVRTPDGWRSVKLGEFAEEETAGKLTIAQAERALDELRAAHERGELDAALAKLHESLAPPESKVAKVPEGAGVTVRTAGEEFFANRICTGKLALLVPENVRRSLDKDIYPAKVCACVEQEGRPPCKCPRFGDLPIRDITRKQAGDVVRRVARRAPVLAGHVLGHLKQLWDFAEDEGHLPEGHNVCSRLKAQNLGVEDPEEGERALELEEIPIFWHGLDAVKAGLKGGRAGLDELTKTALRLLLLIPERMGELVQAERTEVNPDFTEWVVPVAHRKLKRKQLKRAKELVIPLSPEASLLMQRLFALGGTSRWILPSASRRTKSGHYSEKTLTHAMGRLFGVKKPKPGRKPRVPTVKLPHGPASPHDLRRTFGTRAAPLLGIDEGVVDRCLAHWPDKLRRIYQEAGRSDPYLPARRDALARWSAHVWALVGEPTILPTRVVA